MMPEGVLNQYWKKPLQEEWAAYYCGFYNPHEVDELGAAADAQREKHDEYINQVLIPIMGQHGWQRTASGEWIKRVSRESKGE